MTEFYQLYYEDTQKTSLYPFSIPVKNESLTVFFENDCIVRLVTASKASKVAVCSHKLKQKLRLYVGRPREITLELLESDYDVLSFTRNTSNHKMIAAAEIWHKGFREIMQKLVEGIGKRWPHEVKQPIYQNAFSARREIYQDYVSTYLNPTMELILSDHTINKLAMQNSGYQDLNRNALTPAQCLEKLGIPFYPLIPFLLERLFSVYVENNKIRVTWL